MHLLLNTNTPQVPTRPGARQQLNAAIQHPKTFSVGSIDSRRSAIVLKCTSTSNGGDHRPSESFMSVDEHNEQQKFSPFAESLMRAETDLTKGAGDAEHAAVQDVVISTGLHHAPVSGGVRTTTSRFDLPSPSVAVRNLVEISRFGHLCTCMSGMHHRREGYPFGTVVDFAADGAGVPILCLSPLAIHSRNILENPSCSLVVHMPGWTGLADAMVTIFGDCYQLPRDMQAAARDIFIEKHHGSGKERWLAGNFVYFRMDRIVDIYFVGGFGTVQWIAPEEYLTSCPDDVVLEKPTKTLQLLNEAFSEDLKTLLSTPTQKVSEALFISFDASGAEVRVKRADFSVQRIGFHTKVKNVYELMSSMRDAVTSMRQQQVSIPDNGNDYGKPKLW